MHFILARCCLQYFRNTAMLISGTKSIIARIYAKMNYRIKIYEELYEHGNNLDEGMSSNWLDEASRTGQFFFYPIV